MRIVIVYVCIIAWENPFVKGFLKKFRFFRKIFLDEKTTESGLDSVALLL